MRDGVNATDYAESAPAAHQGPRAAGPDLPVTIIRPDRGWFDWRLRQLWRYRDLVSMFVWRDFVATYKQTILGPAWHVVRPVLTTLIFTVVFGRMAGLSTEGAPPFLFYMAGLLPWTYFATAVETVAKTFVANANLLGKVYFHRLAIPLSIVLSTFIAFGIQLGVFAVILIGYVARGTSIHMTGWLAAAPLLMLIVAGYALAFGIIVCAITTKYRDLAHVFTFAVQLWLYVTPVIYPVSSVPKRYQMLVWLNPLTPLVEGFRLAFIGVGTVTPSDVVISGAAMGLLLVLGLMLFSRVERTFMDTV